MKNLIAIFLGLIAFAASAQGPTYNTPSRNNQVITGGSVNGTPIGQTTPAAGAFTSLTTTSNAAIGTTSSSWGSGFRAIEVGAQGNALFSDTSGSFNTLLSNNAYFDGGNWRYVRSSAATHIEQINGVINFFTSPSGTAGNVISWTKQLQVDANGVTAAAGAFTVSTSMTVGSASLTVPTGGIGLSKITADGSAPGAGGAKLELVCGTNAGSAKLIMYAGTSTTPVTIIDNVGTGVTGC
jgi:phage baseplate assembly protein gpV